MVRPDEELTRGYRFDDDRTICDVCITDEDLDDSEAYEILSDTDVDQADGYLYCDRCGSRLLS